MLTELQLDEKARWKQRFRTPAIFVTRIACQAPTRGLAVSNQSDVYQLYAWDVPSGDLTQLTEQPEGKMLGFISPTGEHVYYLDDRQGDEIGHFVRIPFEGGEKEDVTPDLPLYSPAGLAFSREGNRIGLIAGTREGFHLYTMGLEPSGKVSAPRLLYHSQPLMRGAFLSRDGRVAVVASTEHSGKLQFSLLAFDTGSGERIAELWDGEDTSLQAVRFSPLPGDTRLLATTNRTGVERLLLWDPRTGERTDLTVEGTKGAMTGFDWSPDGKRILFSVFSQAVQRLHIYDLERDTAFELDHPPGNPGNSYIPPYFAPDGDIYTHFQTATHPCQVVALDSQTGAKKRVVLAAGEAPQSRPWKSISFTSTDGQEIQGWLALPEGEGPFPTILETHGGPTAVAEEQFDAGCQAWLDHGFAYLTINYRGSTSFGRQFQDKIIGDLGHWEVEDMVAARDWLVDQGIARPDAILLTGWSYGGYLTLMALSKRPDLWAGGMAGIAIADWTVQYEDSAEALRGYQVALFGGTPEEEPEAYAASSPITYVERVQAPVLIIQGRNDTRTPARPVEIYEEKMKALGKPIEMHWFDAGHMGSMAHADQAIAHQELMLRFAYRVLGESP